MGACARSWFTSLWSHRVTLKCVLVCASGEKNAVKLSFTEWECVCVRPCYIHQCSAECGQGNRTRTTVCLMNHVTDLPLDSCEGEHPAELTSCDSGPCQNRLEWYTGPWGQVIKTHMYILYNYHPHSMLPYKCVCVCQVFHWVWEWHTNPQCGLYFQWQWSYGGCGSIEMFQSAAACHSSALQTEAMWCPVVCHRVEHGKCPRVCHYTINLSQSVCCLKCHFWL